MGDIYTLEPGQFKIGSTFSSTLGDSRIQLRPQMEVPIRKGAMISAPGVDGDYIIDQNAYANTRMQLELICQVDSEDTIHTTKEAIALAFDSGGYLPLELYSDSKRVYYVKTLSGPNFRESGEWPTIILYSIELSIKPFKMDLEGFEIVAPRVIDGQTINNVTLTNPYLFAAKPKITMVGSGDMELIVNSKTFIFKGVDDHIVIDSEFEDAYKIASTGEFTPRNDRMYTREFPLLTSGSNVITYTGAATSIKVEGRWGTLVS